MAVDDYQRVCAPAADVLQRLSTQVVDDLDESVGGVGWWDGQVDFRRRVVLSEYLIDSLNGAAEALLDAALAAQDYRELLHADDTWLVSRWRAVAHNATASDAQFLAASKRGPSELRRERRLDSSVTHAVGHAMRVLDCLGAAFLIIGAVPKRVRRADWADVEHLAEQASSSSTTPMLEPAGTKGREIQDALLAKVPTWSQHGPEDWLPWLRSMRNGRIHRAARINWQLLYGKRNSPEGLLRVFPTNPELTDVELMIRTPGTNFQGVRIVRRSTDIIDGSIDSMTSYCASLASALERCWAERRSDPTLLCQRGAQWQDLERVTNLSFPGYGSSPNQLGDRLHVGPALGKRLRSAHVMAGQRDRWRD